MRSLKTFGDFVLLLWVQLATWGVLAVLCFSIYFAAANSYAAPLGEGELRALKTAFWAIYVGTIAVAMGAEWLAANSIRARLLGVAAIGASLVLAVLLSLWLLHALSFMNECALGVSYPLASGDCGR